MRASAPGARPIITPPRAAAATKANTWDQPRNSGFTWASASTSSSYSVPVISISVTVSLDAIAHTLRTACASVSTLARRSGEHLATFGTVTDLPMSPVSCRVAVKIDGLILGWSSGVRLHVDDNALVLESDVGRVTLPRTSVDGIITRARLSARGVQVTTQGSATLHLGVRPRRDRVDARRSGVAGRCTGRSQRFVGLWGSRSEAVPTFRTDRALVSSQ